MIVLVMQIVKYPSPVLKQKALPVEKVTPEIVSLLDEMAETMYSAQGVGLAAPQVGISKRIIVIDIREPARLIQIVNPEIISAEGEIEWEEGCLSIPEFTLKMKRKAKVKVRGLNKDNKLIEIEAEGLLAVAFQHEIDHLDGKLLIDNISSLKRELYVKKIKKAAIL